MLDSVVPDHFTIPFTFSGDGLFNHRAASHAIRDALGLAASLDFSCSERHHVSLTPLDPAKTYPAQLRINGLYKPKTIPGRPQPEYIAYSYLVFDEEGAVCAWSCDLDSAYSPKSGYTYFHEDHVTLPMTDALRAAIKALVPKKTRAKKTP